MCPGACVHFKLKGISKDYLSLLKATQASPNRLIIRASFFSFPEAVRADWSQRGSSYFDKFIATKT